MKWAAKKAQKLLLKAKDMLTRNKTCFKYSLSKKNYHLSDMQMYQFLSKFSRWLPAEKRRETWEEAIDRVIEFFKTRKALQKIKPEIFEILKIAMLNQEVFPALRILQMAGPPLERCNVGAYNCAYLPISDLRAFSEMLYILMQGTGCGFSVEKKYVNQLPAINNPTTADQNKSGEKIRWVIKDSTEGWCDALYSGMLLMFSGKRVEFDYSLIRPSGAVLKTKGGTASGPEPLKELLDFIAKIIQSKPNNHKLTELDCHDICCKIGSIVQVGGVRRASEISLSDLNNIEMRYAKHGDWFEWAPWRAMANNSAVYEEKPPIDVFNQEWLALRMSGSGERGIFNRSAVRNKIPIRRKRNDNFDSYFDKYGSDYGTNPCAEIILRPYQFCNLSIAIARPDDTAESLAAKVRLATIFGIMQSTLTDFKYLRPEWKKNCEEERLLGVDITGHADCPLLQYNTPERSELLKQLKQVALETAEEFSELIGINMPTAVTCIKPSGDSSQLFDCASGVHPRFSKYYIRRVREPKNSPVAALLLDHEVPHITDPYNPKMLVFEFPMRAPEGAVVGDNITAKDMLENWKSWNDNWAEHSVSCTVYVKDAEWPDVGGWVYENFDKITGLSFLPKSGGSYKAAPYEKIDEETYNELIKKFPKIDWSKLKDYENEDHTIVATTYACTAGSCEV